jgi:hypothetical protein
VWHGFDCQTDGNVLAEIDSIALSDTRPFISQGEVATRFFAVLNEVSPLAQAAWA